MPNKTYTDWSARTQSRTQSRKHKTAQERRRSLAVPDQVRAIFRAASVGNLRRYSGLFGKCSAVAKEPEMAGLFLWSTRACVLLKQSENQQICFRTSTTQTGKCLQITIWYAAYRLLCSGGGLPIVCCKHSVNNLAASRLFCKWNNSCVLSEVPR